MVDAMDTYQLPVKETTGGSEHQYWVRGIATRKDTTNLANDEIKVLLVNFDNALFVEETVLVTVADIPFSSTVTVRQYRIDQVTSNLCFDGGWGKTVSSSPVEFQDTTGTKFWDTSALVTKTLVDASNDSFSISSNTGNLIRLSGTSEPDPGIYHILNSGGQSPALVDSTTATVSGGDLEVEVFMPANSVILFRVKD